MKTFFMLCAVMTIGSVQAWAQSSPESVFSRAQTLVSEGQGAQGRALVDSMYRASPPASNERAEALFWRASLAANAAEAERDYRAIVVDHATSPRVEDALLRLAQLELARGDRDGALRHLQRLTTEFPASRQGARTSYWTARVLFDKGDVPAACAANTGALSRVLATEIELKNQIEYQHQRCRGVAGIVAASGTGSASAAAQPPRITPGPPSDITPSIPLEQPVGPATPASAQAFSVQVAAANTRAIAQTIVRRMAGRGYQARIDGTVAPFRVRIGRYPTRAAAARMLAELKAKGIDGFVATVESR